MAEAALRESEFRWKFALEGSGDGLWDWNLAKDAVHFSKRWKKMLGYEEHEISNHFEEWRKRVHPEDFQPTTSALQAHLDGSTPHYTAELRMRCKDGSWKWILTRGLVVERDGQGKAKRMIGTHTDITARKQAEISLRNAEEQLRQSQKLEAVGTLAGGIAHDFNNIVMGIYGFTELARKASEGNEEALDYLDEISNAGRRARDLVRQILAFSRAETQPLEAIELHHIVIEALHLLKATIPANIELQTEIAKDLPLIQGNSTQLHQVIVNLGTNAIHAMADASGTLSVQLDHQILDTEQAHELNNSLPGPYARLTVSDTGQGMSEETKARVFEPFFTTKEPGKGTGLGLSVVHGIIQNHGGSIRITSHPDQGTSIEVYLPVKRVETVTPVEESGHEPRGTGERILFVDDDPAILRSGVITLRGLGYDVVGKSSPIEALRLVQDNPDAFHLIITDQIMPGLTGLELATQVHELRPKLPVIIASGYSNELSLEQIQPSGVEEIIFKPYTNQDMAATIKRSLSQFSSR